MTVEQISVFVENRSGQLGDVAHALRDAGVNIRAMSLSDTADFGVLRLMADDTAKARDVLQRKGFTVGTTPVVAVEVPDRPGGLADILEIMATRRINVEYLYAYTQRDSSRATLVFRFDRNAEALAALREEGCKVLSAEELSS